MAKEIGRIGQLRNGYRGTGSIFFEEFLPELQGIKGVQAYTEMADNDATVGAILFAIEMLMRQCEFHIEPGGDSEKDREAAEFVESCMDDMERTWADTLSEILSFMTYGWSYHEIVYKRRMGKSSSPITNSKHSDGLIGWRKLPIRAQDTLYGWEYADDSDDLLGMTQMPPPTYQRITIPLEKAMHFRTRSRKDNPEGRSILRTAYRAYYFKKRLEEIEGYGMERDLAGFPVLYSPPDINIWDGEDEEMREVLARAEYIVSSIRRDAREGLVLPGGENGWKLELVSSGSRRQFDTNAIIDRYDKRIATSVLADFVMLGQQSVGSFALADSKTQIFAMAIGTYLDVICEVFNNQGIPRLIDINGDHFKGISDYPRMVHGDIDEPDLANFAAFIEKMVGAGVLIPDEGLEEEVRRIGHLPEKVETDAPAGDRSAPAQTDAESKSVYKITSILEKYQAGKTTRDAAAQLLGSLDLTPEQVEFYLTEAEKAPHDGGDSSASAAKPAGKKNAQAEDEQDAAAAEDAKKSLGRGM
nr:MAG TPA: Portal protein [Caudoviricetes sp.]